MSLVVLFFILCGLNLKVNGDEEYGGLTFDFYNKTCPQLEKIVEDAISSMSKEDPRTPAALLRLLFNDCVVMGCDASILLDLKDRSKSEMGSFSNFGIKKRELIGQIKSMVDKVCPKQVSCADILVLAARESVAISQGPRIRVPLGRRDSTVAYTNFDADTHLPQVDSFLGYSLGKLRDLGGGMTDEEVVALLGAHTLGTSSCATIQYRVDFPGIIETDTNFVNKLRKTCPKGALSNYNTSLANDRTPYKFDNDYYSASFGGRSLLVIDATLTQDQRTVEQAGRFVTDQAYFFKMFSSAFVKLSVTQVLTGNDGEIRNQCNKLNRAN
ncbi:hypothetical protein ABFS82_08G015900 [Erythranthe guttata]|nr:PREDICTED: peroxidase 29-like [Erythranthe guttata]|eukprot:XP_012850697.1 PREDICTED: peroxidase 29-like [Erythranthe guttata]